MGRVAPAVMVAALVLAACGTPRPNLAEPGVERQVADSSTTDPSPTRPTLRLAVDGWTGDPADAGPADVGRRVVADLLFDGLTRLDADGGVVPAVAESWSVSPDRLRWVFVVSSDAVDGRGDPITARSVMLSLDRVAARGRSDLVATALTAVAGWGDRMDGRAGGVAGITAPFHDQLVIRLDRPFEPLPEVLASPAFGIVVAGVDDLVTTGPFRPGVRGGPDLVPVDETSALPFIDVVDADATIAASLLASGEVDWAVLDPASGTADLPGDVIRLPIEVAVALAIRAEAGPTRRALAAAVDSVGLAGMAGLVPNPPTLAVGTVGDLPSAVRMDIPTGPLEVLGPALTDQLAEAGVEAEVVVSDIEQFAARIIDGSLGMHPIVSVGGSWAFAGVADSLVPEAANDLISIDSADRASIGASLLEARDPTDRAFLADVLLQTAIDEAVVLPIGQVEVRIGLSPAAAGLRHRTDGTLDVSRFG